MCHDAQKAKDDNSGKFNSATVDSVKNIEIGQARVQLSEIIDC